MAGYGGKDVAIIALAKRSQGEKSKRIEGDNR